jgi:hypothetical protein
VLVLDLTEERSQEADLICSIESVDRQCIGWGLRVPDLTNFNVHVDGMNVEEGFPKMLT